jgi:hypothetical protein
VFLYIVDAIPEYLKSKYTYHAALYAEMEARMDCMPRSDDFNLPCRDGGYIRDRSRIQAMEHRTVMQVSFTAVTACIKHLSVTQLVKCNARHV